MAARNFIWTAIGGGAWGLAANWNDQTDGVDPSAIVPGPQDNVSVPGPTGAAIEAIVGGGTVAGAAFTGNSILSGTYAIGTLAVGQSAASGMLQVGPGAYLATGTGTLSAGSLLINGTGARFSAQGNFALASAATGLSAAIEATGGGSASLLGATLNASGAAVYVDPESIIEIGTIGAAAAGALTIDTGFALSGQGDANQYGATVNDGTIAASGGTLCVGTLTGNGLLSIGAGATLDLYGTTGSGQSVAFAGANGTLTLRAEYFAPQGTITGFATGDALDVAGSEISSATFSQTSRAAGTLTLWYGNQAADRIALAGTYTGYSFLTAGDGAGGTLITLAPSSSNGGTPSPGTNTPDAYLWTAAGSGAWGLAANWEDTTTGAEPAAIAPGINDSDTIAASQSTFTVIGGPANAASLSLTGEAALTGNYAIGTLSIGQASGTSFTDGTLDFLPGTSIATASTSIAAGALSVAGSASSLTVGGTLTLGGGVAGVGLPVTALTVSAGASVRAGTLSIGGGSGDSIVTDPVSSFEIGTLGGAAPGAVTLDPGAVIVGNGSINPLGVVIDNGHILATGGVLTLGAVSGSGELFITQGTLALNYATAVPISMYSLNAVLAVSGEQALPTGTLTGFTLSDQIDILGDPITGVTFTAAGNGSGGVLTFFYGSTSVGSLSLAGSYSQLGFVCVPDGSNGTLIDVTRQSTGGGGGGQTGTDQLVWTGAADTNWDNAANWFDSTTGSVATAPPGAETPVTVAGTTLTHLKSIGGTGTCASLLFNGNLAVQGDFTAGTLTFGSDPSGSQTATAASIDIGSAATLTAAANAFLADGGLTVGDGASLSVAGTLVLGDGAESPVLTLQGGGQAQLGALSLGGGSLGVDSVSTLEIGVSGEAGAGTLAIAAGHAATGYGLLNVFGYTADAGTITALGGTLTLGAVGGSGVVSAATESTLALDAPCSAQVSFAGAGATLLLLDPAAYPSGAISGFAAGDAIMVASTAVQSVTYVPGAGGTGSLTLAEDGQSIGTLLLNGNFAGDTFAVQPDGAGSEITVAPTVFTGPPPGTTTPDDYVWTGAAGALWADARNWQDTSQGQNPAAIPPGQNDLITIAAAAPLAISGPGDAAVLSLTGTVSLGGTFGIGTLAIGSAQAGGFLALDSGDAIEAVNADVVGGIEGQGGTLSLAGTLALGSGTVAGVAYASGQTALAAQGVSLTGAGSALETDTSASIAIGALAVAQDGWVVVGPDGMLAGNGAVNPAGQVFDGGEIVASGGTLLLGTVSGTGTLLIDPGATLAAYAAAGLTADFSGAGTLSLGSANAPAIEDFGPSDAVILPVSGATSASWALVAPGIGVITILNGTTPLATLTVDGSTGGEVFLVAAAPGGGTVLTASAANMAATGGDTMSNYPLATGGNTLTSSQLLALGQDDVPFAAAYLQDLDDNQTAYIWYLDGAATVGAYNPFGFNAEIIAPQPEGNGGATNNVLQPGYTALAALGTEPINLFDNSVGNALLVGNANVDPVHPTVLVTNMSGDTLVGAAGGNTAFWALNGRDAFIVGGGDDTVYAAEASGASDNVAVTTAGGYHSVVYLGASDNQVVSLGADEIICAGTGIADDTVDAAGPGGGAGPTVFGPLSGVMNVSGGQDYAWAIGNGGEIVLDGGADSGNLLFGGLSNAIYYGGAGEAVVVGGVGPDDPSLFVANGGSGAMTVFGGNGNNTIDGGTGPDVFVVGLGPTTVQATAGNFIWLTGSAPVEVFGSAGMVLIAGGSLGNDSFFTNGGSETLFGGAGDETFYVGSGVGTLVCGSGQDAFNFTNGVSGGNDTIISFRPGLDSIHLQGFGGAIPSLTYNWGNTFFTLPNGTSVVIYGVSVGPSAFTST